MASFNKFNSFIERLVEGGIDLDTHTLKVYLSNATPSATDDSDKADLAEITNENGYTAPLTCSLSSSGQTAGTYKLVLDDPSVITASGGTIGPFRYVVLYDDDHGSDALICWWDYGSSITLQDGETFTIDLSADNGVLQIA
jgi:hypothetical protein